MKKSSKLIPFVFLCGILSATPCIAGGVGSSGGGKGILCGDRLRTLDLYEAEEIDHLPISNRYSRLNPNLKEYGARLADYFFNEPFHVRNWQLRAAVLHLLKTDVIRLFRDIPNGTKLPLTDDATLPSLPAECSVVQIATYSDEFHVILRDRALWEKLSVQDQAALILHEYLYKAAREMRAKTSDDTRKIIGMILSDQELEPIFKPIFGKKHLGCSTFSNSLSDPSLDASVVIANNDSGNGIEIYFPVLNGRFNMGRISTSISGSTIESLYEKGMPYITTTIREDIFGREWNIILSPDTSQVHQFYIQAWLVGSSPQSATTGFCGF